jgi:3-hydroxy-9,10-secoandrosta-1,3,5(10)-triene-9,17-dione monooxygenase reductase component
MSVSSEQFRDAMRHFPTGVTIVTMKAPDAEFTHGMTVSSFLSVSPEPPLVLISIDHRTSGHTILEKEGAVFAVSILPQGKMDLSNRFAWLKDEDRFALGDWETAVTGSPVLKDALAWLDCTVYARHPAGTHTIYIGHVEATGVPLADEPPLLYWNRGYRRLELADRR